MHKFFVVSVAAVLSIFLSGCGQKETSDGRGAVSFLVSSDGGDTFSPYVKSGGEKTIADINIFSFARDPKDARTMYLGTEKSGIFVTHGDTWEHIKFPPQKVYGVAISSSDSNVLYASGTYNGFAKVYRSVDSGKNWDEIYTEPTKDAVITSLVIDPQNAQILYAGTSKGIIVKTNDGGISWTNIYKVNVAVSRIVFDAKDTSTVYFMLHQSGLLKTRDGGKIIEDLTGNISGSIVNTARDINGRGVSAVLGNERRSSNVHTVTVDPSNGGILYVGTDKGLYRSIDYGKTWKTLEIIKSAEQLPIKVIAVNPHNANEITYSVACTLYRSNSDFTQWTPLQISSSRVASVIEYDPLDSELMYVGLSKQKSTQLLSL